MLTLWHTLRSRGASGVLSLALALAATVAASAGMWFLIPTEKPALGTGPAEAVLRRTEVVLRDVEEVWQRSLRDRGTLYRPLVVRFFVGSTESPCAGGRAVSGPFYCRGTGTAFFDLGFLDALGVRLHRSRDLGLAILTARVAAEHLLREIDPAAGTGNALRGDCMAGAWAVQAAARIGPVPERLYGQLVESSRGLVSDLARENLRTPADPLAAGSKADREAAFARGYASGAIAGCLAG